MIMNIGLLELTTQKNKDMKIAYLSMLRRVPKPGHPPIQYIMWPTHTVFTPCPRGTVMGRSTADQRGVNRVILVKYSFQDRVDVIGLQPISIKTRAEWDSSV